MIKNFVYEPIQINKPKLKNSGPEMMTFITYLPFMIGHLIDEESPYWNLFISLRYAARVVFEKSCAPGTHLFLHSLVKELISNYVACFGYTVPPKLHFAFHASMVMENNGPLPNISCNKFEAKHQQFTKISKPLHCRKNFTYSLAHQLILANYLMSHNFNSDDDLITGHVKKCLIPEISNREINVCSYVEYKGLKLKAGVVIQIGIDEYCMPLFGLIQNIIEHNTRKYKIICKVLVNHGFIDHYFAFEVEETNMSVSKNLEDLSIQRISTISKGKGGVYCTGAKLILGTF
jgi:hypothetical protein